MVDFRSVFDIGTGLYSAVGHGKGLGDSANDFNPVKFALNDIGLGADVMGLIQPLLGESAATPIIGVGLTSLATMSLTLGESLESIEQGTGFKAGAEAFNQIGSALEEAFPTSEWEGSGSDAYDTQNGEQLDRAGIMAKADAALAQLINTEAGQVSKARDMLGYAATGLGLAIPVAIALNGTPPVVGTAESVAFQGTAVSIAMAVALPTMTVMAAEAATNAAQVAQIIQQYLQVLTGAQSTTGNGALNAMPDTTTDDDSPSENTEETPDSTPNDSPTETTPTTTSPTTTSPSSTTPTSTSPNSSSPSTTSSSTSSPSSTSPTSSYPSSTTTTTGTTGTSTSSGTDAMSSIGSIFSSMGQQLGQVAQQATQVPQQFAQMAAQAAQQFGQMGAQTGGTEAGTATETAANAAQAVPVSNEHPANNATANDGVAQSDAGDSQHPGASGVQQVAASSPGERAPIHFSVDIDRDQVQGPVQVTFDPQHPSEPTDIKNV